MKIKKSDLINTIKDLIDKGYVRRAGDKGYNPEKKNSIQDHFSDLAGRDLTKSEVNRWFSRFEELKGIRVKPGNIIIIDIIEDDEQESSGQVDSLTNNPTSEENFRMATAPIPDDLHQDFNDPLEKAMEGVDEKEEEKDLDDEDDFPQSNLL